MPYDQACFSVGVYSLNLCSPSFTARQQRFSLRYSREVGLPLPPVLPFRGSLSAITTIEVFTISLVRGPYKVLPIGPRFFKELLLFILAYDRQSLASIN